MYVRLANKNTGVDEANLHFNFLYRKEFIKLEDFQFKELLMGVIISWKINNLENIFQKSNRLYHL